MRFFSILTLLFFASQSFAQDVKGYYITYDGNKVDGYFKEGDFNDLSSLEFKRSSKSDYIKISANAIKEYGVADEFKFEKHLVQVDVSPSNTKDKNPQMKAETLFLSVVIVGKTSLYSYTKDYNTKFFIKTKDKAEPEQLIYKKYLLDNGTVDENTMFRQQLYTLVNCKGNSADYFANVVYYRKQLSDIVKEDNACQGGVAEEFFNGTRKESEFHYSAFAGLFNQKFGLNNETPEVGENTNVTYSVGAEVMYTFPSEKASLFFRIEYESISNTISAVNAQSFNVINCKYEIDGAALNFFFGPRYNFVTLDRHKVFADVGFGISIPMADIDKKAVISNGTGTDYDGESETVKLGAAFCVGAGVGYVYNKTYGIALRYETNRDYLDDALTSYKTQISRLGINLSYYFN